MKNFLTFDQLESLVLDAGKIPESKFTPLQRQIWINGALMTVYDRLEALDDPYYNSIQTLPIVNSQIDLSGIYFKSVVDVGDGTNEFSMVVDPMVFENAKYDRERWSQVVWRVIGDKILLSVGKNVPAMRSLIQVELELKPTPFTEATRSSSIQIPPERNLMLQDEVTSLFFRAAGIPVDAEVSARMGEYSSRYQAKTAKKAKESGEAES